MPMLAGVWPGAPLAHLKNAVRAARDVTPFIRRALDTQSLWLEADAPLRPLPDDSALHKNRLGQVPQS